LRLEPGCGADFYAAGNSSQAEEKIQEDRAEAINGNSLTGYRYEYGMTFDVIDVNILMLLQQKVEEKGGIGTCDKIP